ncbi:nitroreductase family deazaflavin-dependent oxidoreductase [Actinotalea sp. BY-33]|uniref:Nitroreductase family deazaflavin-dependent oxidoreductase n=1 Tax=Actinotalea soli TaxID=2819234 RepID=A0A939LRL1_9CELL|nr:nitroreductase family deazaflavin-dependent oxidoreductase [Actinotalea soli]MBO1751775.1 nitroreductase family deazaflavin-dependent oxidoreductase [Actinotalea soli]
MPIAQRITRINRRALNPLMLRITGHGPLVDLEHVGRRSGTVRHTPLLAFRAGGTVTIALTYGPDVEWLANLRAAGGGRMLMRGEILTLGPPSDLGTSAGLARVPRPVRVALRWPVRCRDFVELPVRSARAAATAR